MVGFDLWTQPTTEIVKQFANAFDIVYHQSEYKLNNLFLSPFSENSIKSRVEKLNAYYHTRIDGKQIKKIIGKLQEYGKDFEEEIKAGDRDAAVKKIATCIEGCNFFSFATKYCSFLESEDYPIFDNQVCRVLNFFQRQYGFYTSDRWLRLEEIRRDKDYQSFVRIIDAFRDYEDENRKKLTVSYKELDKYLWLVGTNNKPFNINPELFTGT